MRSRMCVAWSVALPVILGALASCSLIVKSDVSGVGIGMACKSNGDCHAGSCENDLCVATCTLQSDCPAPSGCYGGKCQLQLKTAVLYVGSISGGEGWTLTHDEALKKTAKDLPYLGWSAEENIVVSDDIAKFVDKHIKDGAQVIVGTSDSHGPDLAKAAEKYPNTKFLVAAAWVGPGKNKNLGSFSSHSEQAWYIQGKVAALKTKTKKLGIVGAFPIPELVRHYNAFTLGAKAVLPDVKVYVNWIGFWYDYRDNPYPNYSYKGETQLHREELLTAKLIDLGCDVISHGADNQRPVRLIEKLTSGASPKIPAGTVWSFGNDNDNAYREQTPTGPGAARKSCLGGMAWNWSVQYTHLLDSMHRGMWAPDPYLNDPMLADAAKSPVNFQLNPEVGLDDSVVRNYVTDTVNKGPDAVFRGPYQFTGQRDKNNTKKSYDAAQEMPDGEVMSALEYRTLCAFVKGIYEVNEKGEERDAKVPDDQNPIEKYDTDVLDPPGAPRGVALNCRGNHE